MKERALACLERRPLFTISLLEPIRRGTATLLYAGEDGVLLFETRSKGYFLYAEEPSVGLRLLSQVPDGAELLLLHQAELIAPAREKLPLPTLFSCRQAVYEKKTPLPLGGLLTFAPLTPAHLPFLLAAYDMLPPDEIALLLEIGAIYGGYRAGELVGFVGTHLEGSIGLLEVLPPFRRSGFGEELERFMVNTLLAQGRIPFAQVLPDNAPSLALQEKLGFTLTQETVHWLSR